MAKTKPRIHAREKSSDTSLLEQVLIGWRVNNGIILELLDSLSDSGLEAVPPHSRSRSVARQFVHMHSARVAWMQYFKAPEAAGIPRFRREPALDRGTLKEVFAKSGAAVEQCVKRLLENRRKVRMFKGSPVLWVLYLIAHDSHHRGQIALTLKQNDMRLPEDVALGTMWRRWHEGIE